MGPALFDQQIQQLRSRAARCRAIGGLLSDVAISVKLSQLAAGLDGAAERLKDACAAVGTIEEDAHRFWDGLNIDSLTPTLLAQNALVPSSQRTTAERWRELSRLFVEEAKSTGHNSEKKAHAEWAYEIAQLAEGVARRADDANTA